MLEPKKTGLHSSNVLIHQRVHSKPTYFFHFGKLFGFTHPQQKILTPIPGILHLLFV